MTLYRVTAQSLEILGVSAASVRITAQSLEALVGTYQVRMPKAVAYAVLGPNPAAVALQKTVAYAVLADPGWVGDPDTVLLLHFEAATSASAILDSSPSSHAVTLTSSTLTTAQKKFGDQSLSSSGGGSGNAAIADNLADFQFGSGRFTIEAWINWSTSSLGASNYTVMGNFSGTTNLGWTLRRTAGLFGFAYSTTGTDFPVIEAAWTPAAGQWYHVAVDRDASNVIRVYIDGVVHASATVTASLFASTRTLYVGNDGNLTRGFAGHIDEVRISKGIARYGGAFTPPTAAFGEAVVIPPVASRRSIVVAFLG